MQPESLFAVRVVSDTDWPAVAVTVFGPIVGLFVGGWVTFRATVAAERRRFDDETKQLAMSIAVEVREGLRILDESIGRAKQYDLESALATIAYADPTIHPLPITAAAAVKVGRFPGDISSLVARLLANASDFRQKWGTIQNMLRAAALPPEKLDERMLDAKATTDTMIAAAKDLAAAIDKRYGSRPI